MTSDRAGAGERPAHLRPTVTSRGFTHLPDVHSTYGGAVRAYESYESSAASGPHVWLAVQQPRDLNRRDSPLRECVAHLTCDDAWHLAEQLITLVLDHYQGGVEPPADRAYDVVPRRAPAHGGVVARPDVPCVDPDCAAWWEHAAHGDAGATDDPAASCATCWPRSCGEPGTERSACRRRAENQPEVKSE